MNTELWVALLTFLTSAAGVARWLIHVYWTQAKTIEDLRNQHQRQTIIKLEATLSGHKAIIDAHTKKLDEVQDRLLKIQGQMAKHNQDTELAIKMLSDTIETTAAKFKKYESDLVAISKNMIMVKGKGQ